VKKILVTGANGQLGTTLKKLSPTSSHHWIFTTRKELDIANSNSVNLFFTENEFDICINCAAYTKVEDAEKEAKQAGEINVEAVQKLVLACNEKQCTLIHISTDYVFDGTKETPYTEADPTAPLNQYGISKLLGELQIQQNSNSFYILRTSWLYSKTLGSNFYSAILKKAQNGDSLTVVNDQTGTPTDVDNLAAFIIKIIDKEPAIGLYHFSDEKIMTWYDLAVQILKEHKLTNPIAPGSTEKGGAVRPQYSPLISIKKF
jgi:dTDP-4-dehydrorhamnose reductase